MDEITLHQLLEACNNCEAAFLDAAEKERGGPLQEVYRQYAAEVAKFGLELQGQIERVGGNEKLVRTENEEDVASQSVEWNIDDQLRNALSLYNRALAQQWPTGLNDTLERQFTLFEEAADHLEEAKGQPMPDL